MMSAFKIANHVIGDCRTFIIAEIGQNHQGDLNVAKRMIREAKATGADCVKFQKSCLHEKFTTKALQRPYESVNSFGKTYGEHKEHLEFSIDQYRQLQAYANELSIIFTASAMDIQSLQNLYDLNVPVIKIGSGDTNNFQLLTKAAQNATPLIISTGMQHQSTVERIVKLMGDHNKTNFCLLHCVSAYPTPAEDASLRMLDLYRKRFPNTCLGYSGHEEGIGISAAAVLLGAKVVERHFTLDKQQKGTDHKLSLEPAQLHQLTSLIRAIEMHQFPNADNDEIVLSALEKHISEKEYDDVKLALKPINEKRILESEMPCRLKLGKSLVYQSDLKSNSVVTLDSVCAKVSEPFGISAEYIDAYVGRRLNQDVLFDENLSESHFL